MNPLEVLETIARTPAPTFAEDERAALLMHLWKALGLHPERDAAGNVLAWLGPPTAGALCLAAHLDTVFPAETPLEFHEHKGRLTGPGIGDNAASLAVLSAFAAAAGQMNLSCPILLAATTGEEGLGDLKGAKHLLATRGAELAAFIAVDGYLGLIVDQPIGVRRWRAEFRTEGGHSWGDAGRPSAIRALAEAIAELYRLELPKTPRTTLNVGTIRGGTSVNSIAAEASLLVDLRSLDAPVLVHLENEVKRVLKQSAHSFQSALELVSVGNRPTGVVNNAWLVALAINALEHIGRFNRCVAASTDANAAVGSGVPAIGFGVYRGGNAHRRDEWVELESLDEGLKALQTFVQIFASRGVSSTKLP